MISFTHRVPAASLRRGILCLGLAAFIPGLSFSQSVEAKLAECRKQIDATDRQIVDLLNQRAKIVAQVGSIKKEAHLPVAAPARESQVLNHIVEIGKAGPLPPETLRRIYATVVQEMRTWEASLSDGNQGH